jgi:hypothetical protein
MSKDPAVLFYADNFLSGTMFLSDTQVGRYIRALCAQQIHGHLTKEQLEGIIKNDPEIIKKFDVDDQGLFFNARMDKEIAKRRKYSESRSKNRKSVPKPNDISEEMEKDMSNHMCQHMETLNTKYEFNSEFNSLGKYENPFFEKFKKAYPDKDSAIMPNVESWFYKKSLEPSFDFNKVIESATDYDAFCRIKYAGTYPYGNFIKRAENWLEKEWEWDWKERTRAAKIEADKNNPAGDESLYDRYLREKGEIVNAK